MATKKTTVQPKCFEAPEKKIEREANELVKKIFYKPAGVKAKSFIVTVNGENMQIPYGEEVSIKRKYIEVIEAAQVAQAAADDAAEKMASNE